MTKNRFIWADVVRVFAIYLVIVVHSTLFPTQLNSTAAALRLFFFNVAATCVPLFVMLSGSLLLGKKESYGSFFSKRIVRLLLPWVSWTLIYFLANFHIQNVLGLARQFATTFESFWFLPMILGLYCLTPALRIFTKAAQKRDIWLIIILWFFVVSFMPYDRNSLAFPRQVDDGLLRQVINYLGSYLLGFQLTTTKILRNRIVSFAMIAVGAIWCVIGTILISRGTPVLLGDFYRYISPGIVFSSVGIFTLILHSQEFFVKKMSTRMTNIVRPASSCALGVYFIHPFIQQGIHRLLGGDIFSSNIFFDNYANGVVIFLISLGIIMLLYQIRLLRRCIC